VSLHRDFAAGRFGTVGRSTSNQGAGPHCAADVARPRWGGDRI